MFEELEEDQFGTVGKLQMPQGAEREWFFYEGLKKLSEMRKSEENEALTKMKEDFYIDYAEIDGEDQKLGMHLPDSMMQGL